MPPAGIVTSSAGVATPACAGVNVTQPPCVATVPPLAASTAGGAPAPAGRVPGCSATPCMRRSSASAAPRTSSGARTSSPTLAAGVPRSRAIAKYCPARTTTKGYPEIPAAGWSALITGRVISSVVRPVRVSRPWSRRKRAPVRMDATLATSTSSAAPAAMSQARREIVTPASSSTISATTNTAATYTYRLAAAGPSPARSNAVSSQNAARMASSVNTRAGIRGMRQRRQTSRAAAATASGRPQPSAVPSSPISAPARPATALSVAAAESAANSGAGPNWWLTELASW